MIEDAKPNICIDCGGMVIGGEPMHRMKFIVHLKTGKEVRYEHRCMECTEQIARDLWNDDCGPCPYLQMTKPKMVS